MSRDGSQTVLSETVEDRILVRGRDLADELIGRVTFTEMFLIELHGERPSSQHVRMMDAVLVSLMEHGITPSTLAARIVLDGAPESIQGAVAAGLLATGSRFLGVIEEIAAYVHGVVEASVEGDVTTAAMRAVRESLAVGRRVAGFGHNLHVREDPRVAVLTALARENGFYREHLAALAAIHDALNEQSSRPLLMNAAGVVGALLCDLGYEPDLVRGFALVARSAGLVAHIDDERQRPIARGVWQHAHETLGKDAR
jgi:citrate synthase